MGNRCARREGASFRAYDANFYNSGVRSGPAHERCSYRSRSGVFQKLTPSHDFLPGVSIPELASMFVGMRVRNKTSISSPRAQLGLARLSWTA